MTDIVLRQQFAAAGTGAHTRTVGQSLAVQTDGMTVTVQGSNVPEDASSWQTIGTASGYTEKPLTTPLAFLRVVADGAGIVSISAADGAAGGSGGGGGAGDASAANQTTQITAAATTNTRLGDVTETAPATDTASSGINGRLQRVAQRLTSLIANIPALTVTATRLLVDGSGVTQPVSAASLPLPTGAATAANQSSELTLVGAVTETAPGTDTASSGLNGRLQRIAQRLTSLIGVLPASLGAKTAANSLSTTPASDATYTLTPTSIVVSQSVTRPANTTAYTANDVVGGAITFAAIGASAGYITILGADLRYDVAAVPSGMSNMRLYLYQKTPPSATADNGAWDLPSGDRADFIGYIDLVAPADLGSTLYVQVSGLNYQIKLGAGETALYGYLVTTGGYTPAANSETFRVTLRALASL